MAEQRRVEQRSVRRRATFLFVAVCSALFVAAASAQVTVQLVPSAPFAAPGGTVDVAVQVSGLGAGAAPSIRAFDLDVTFDPSKFTYQSVTFGALLGDPAAMPAEAVTGGPAVAAGTLGSLIEVSLLSTPALHPLQPTTFTLLTLRFQNVGQGVAMFGATVTSLGDQDANPIAVPAVAPVNVQAQSVNDIPTLSEVGIATLVLLLMLGGLVVLRRLGS